MNARRNVPEHGIRLCRSPPREKPKSMVKENDLEVNRSHFNTSVTREIAQNLIQSRLPHSHHWEPPGSSFFATCDNLDKVPFSVCIDAVMIIIRYVVFVLFTPPENMAIPGSIAVLATLVEFERNGFGSDALKVALLYMKEHYVHRNVQVLADTFEDYLGGSAVDYWETMGLKFSEREPVVRKGGDTESVCQWMEA